MATGDADGILPLVCCDPTSLRGRSALHMARHALADASPKRAPGPPRISPRVRARCLRPVGNRPPLPTRLRRRVQGGRGRRRGNATAPPSGPLGESGRRSSDIRDCRAMPSHHEPAAIDVDGLAVDVGGAGAAEESDQLADLFRLARPTEWDRVHNGVANGARAGDVFHAVSVRKAGTDAVDVDFVSGQLGGEDLRKEDEASLRHGVGAKAGQALAAGDRAEIDDAAALTLLDEGAADGFRHEEGAVEINVKHAPPLAFL